MQDETGIDLKGSRILIVDDVPKNIQVLGSTLRNEGYDVIPAAGGEQALKSAATHHPDLVLLDVMMPDMNGYETLEKMREVPGCKETPVIFVTALSEETDEEKGLKLGAVDYITKPINIPITLARVAAHLRLARARQQLAEQNQELIEAAKLREDVDRMARHDLKNPLQIIISGPTIVGFAGPLNAQQTDLLERIRSSGYRMLEMINFSLDMYKMETRVYEFKPVPVDLLNLMERIHGEVQGPLRDKGLAWRLLCDGAKPADGESLIVPAEDLLCYSMFANLIKNAIEASPIGDEVTIRVHSGNPVKADVHNKGAVPESMRERFFDKYATHGKERGTGLGTYSAWLIAQTQKGKIRMQTDESKGTTITVEFASEQQAWPQP